MTHDTPNLDHYCTSHMSQKLQNGHIFYMYSVVFEHYLLTSKPKLLKLVINSHYITLVSLRAQIISYIHYA
jgi:hypothetical protein